MNRDAPHYRRLAILAVTVVMAVSVASGVLEAQRRPVTREALEAAVKTAEASKRRDVAARLRERLREGDFQPGHRIVLTVETDSTLTDTFTVRADRKLLLPNLPLISLEGVLESELNTYLEKELSKYIRNPSVRAEPLLQVSVLGSVARPGFYSVPTDVTLGDAIMQAGGPSPTSDIRKIEIRRSSKTAISRSEVQEAIRLGETLGDLGVRPGDELWIPDKNATNWTRILTIVSSAATLGYTLSWALSR
jgi:protein involved in polysaccharide export with SLBB domain